MPACLAAAASASISAPGSLACRRLKMAVNPIFLISATADGVTAPAHATVVSTVARFVIPGTVCLVTCACAAVSDTAITATAVSVSKPFIVHPQYERPYYPQMLERGR